MVIATRPDELYGLEVKTQDGTKIGKVEEVYLDNLTGRPEWAEVKGGLFGHRKTIVPLSPARRVDGDGSVELPFDADRVKNAPDVGEDAIDPAEEARLFDYYGIPYADPVVRPPAQPTVPPVAPPAGVPATDAAGAAAPASIEEDERAVVLHGEEPVVEKRVVPKERVRIETVQAVEDAPVDAELRKERVDTEGVDRA